MYSIYNTRDSLTERKFVMHGMKEYESSGGTIHAFLTSVLDGVEWQAACIRQYPLNRMLGGIQPPNECLAVEK